MSDPEKDVSADATGLEVAVIGMAGRFPGAETVEDFWRNLRDGVESLKVLTDEELRETGVAPEVYRSPKYVRVARTIPDADHFDAAFFGVNPREADAMDPQQRLFLECSWAALEDAGYDPERYPGSVGVFAGARMSWYLMNVYSHPELVRAVGDLTAQIANDKDYLATRVSYKLNLGGPSVTVQTACSTALVATHMACQALLSGECDIALAGGVAVRLPDNGYMFRPSDINSPDGHVRAFDARAQGTIFGNGMGAVVLKRLADALADGDTIHAVVKGSAITNDGSQKVGYTAPGVDGQYRVIKAALATAEVEPESISYVEAHGTGTPVGDPIELTALTKAFRERTEARQFCAIGSVKTNVGHLAAAAGAAGLIKTVLALKHRQIPPSLLFERPNPQIDFESSPFFVNTRLRDWETDGRPRRAGVSAFGIGGTNAHIVLEEAPEPEPAGPSRSWQLLLLSARSEAALANVTANLAAHLESHPELDLADAAYTLRAGRKLHEHRRAVVCRDAGHAVRVLRELEAEFAATGFAPGREPSAAFLFSGQGAQYPGMGRGLYAAEPLFRETVDRCCERLLPLLGLDLRELLFAAETDEKAAEAAERLGQTRFTQPALFVVEYALARLWMSWGIEPKAMMGHSIGEYVAACLAGVFPLDDALALVAERGRLMQSLPSGAMLAVPLAEAEVAPLLGPGLSLAAVNAPDRCVVSGPHEAVEALRAALEARGVGARPLHTSHAFHSTMMEPILEPFVQRFAGIRLQPPQIPYVSNVTGTWITPEEATDPAYWARHLRQAVRFADGVRELCAEPGRVLLEVGPGTTLATLVRQHPDAGSNRGVLSSLRHPKDRKEDLAVLLKTLGQLWLRGIAPDWSGFHAGERRRRVPLPTYPFERQRYWVERSAGGLGQAAPADTRKKQDVADWFYLPYWKPAATPTPSPEALEQGGRWLLFLDEAGVGERAAARLAAEGRRVLTVRAGEGFRRLDEGSWEIAPGRRDDYDALLKDLAADGNLPDRVLHLWNLGPAGPGDLDRLPERSFWSLLYLAQAFGRNSVSQRVHLAVVSSQMQRVAGEERLVPERAMLLGPVKSISQEYPNVRCASVDVALPASDALVGRLIAEAAAEPARPVVAYRNGGRWVQSYEAVRLEPADAGAVRLRERGVYLITGGLGGLGLTFAEFLARDYRARLVLLGVSALPGRESWDEWLAAHGEGDRVSRRIRKLRELEALGAEVLAVSADVADRERMRAVVAEALARFGEIHGVIHSAGVPGGGVIQLKTDEAAAKVISPKVAGTRALMEALGGAPLDFVALCSSTIAVAGGLGQVDYCAANNFLDAFAQDTALAGGPRTVSINWGAWEEVGMAVAAGLMPYRPGAAAEAPPVAENVHPLLDRCLRQSAEQGVYATDFSPSRHWVMDEHRILGTPTLPGTTHLELARAAFAHHAAAFGGAPEGGIELRDVYFFSPLLLPEGETRELRVTLDKEGDGFTFQVASRLPSPNGGEPVWQPHARGKVAALAPAPRRASLDLGAILARCGEREIATGPAEAAAEPSEKLVHWGAHWQSLKGIHLGQGEALARIELPEELAGEVDSYGLHPALLDVATGIAGAVERESYLPLSYRRVLTHRALPRRFYSYLRQDGQRAEGSETLSVDITILSEEGEPLVEIEHFSMKRVGGAADGFKRAAAEAEGAAVAAEAEPAEEPESSGILPREGVEALRRILARDLEAPQVVATARDLHALIASVSAADRSAVLGGAGAGAAQAAIHARPNIPTPYVAPASEAERRLAEIWQVTLGIEQVGVNDNFFDLGGDSILGVHIIARASAAGLQLSPDQLFERQTVAELAKLFPDPEPEAAAAPLPVTAFQRELLEAGAGACWYTVWPLPAGAGSEVLRRAVELVTARHDALRTRFTRGPEGWIQAPAEPAAPVEVREMAGGAEAAALARELGAGLDPERGTLAAAAVLNGGEGTKRALLVAHPLAADAAAWGLLREEARSVCQQLAAGGEAGLPPAPAGFRAWLAERAERLRSQGLRPESAAWLVSWEACAAPPAIDPAAWPDGAGAVEEVSVRLDAEETRAVLTEIPDLQRVRPEEAVLAALAKTLARGAAGRSVLVRVEADARESEPLNADLPRTVGCFSAALPVLLGLGESGDLVEELRLVKEQLRGAVANGADAVLLGGLAGDEDVRRRLAALPAAEVSLLYRGDAQSVGGRPDGAPLTVTGQLDGEGLRFDWRVGGGRLGGAVAAMAAGFLAELRALIAVCRSGSVAVYTPSDFPDAELSQEELDKLFS
ncbi:MAG: SDR family NAD(P)-dependent oxidoreductase [Thermoanaerobaculia bacterium]